jgi:hypothetical protein
MAKISKQVSSKGVSWRVDCYGPQGKRIKRSFPRKMEAEVFLAKVFEAKAGVLPWASR